MSTIQSVMDELKAKGNEKARVTYSRHGIPIERTFGVSVADLKTIAKRIKGQQELACELYATGNMDAMYLAGMVADGSKMTREQLQAWAEGAAGMPMIGDHTVPWVTLDNPAARELAIEWIGSKDVDVAATGWSTYSGLLSVRPDDALDLSEIEGLLATAVRDVHGADNRVKSKMNSFVISVGTYVKPLLERAKAAAQQVGKVSVDMGDTACKVPFAVEYIAKVESSGKVGQKRKTIRC